MTLVITPNVPSDPQMSEVRSYPADVLRAVVPVAVTTSPEGGGRTISRDRMLELIGPYLTVVVPDSPQAIVL